eukprot:2636155-Amphidinium_carterae.1
MVTHRAQRRLRDALLTRGSSLSSVGTRLDHAIGRRLKDRWAINCADAYSTPYNIASDAGHSLGPQGT